MSIAASTLRSKSINSSSSPPSRSASSPSTTDMSKKVKQEENCVPVVKNCQETPSNGNQTSTVSNKITATSSASESSPSQDSSFNQTQNGTSLIPSNNFNGYGPSAPTHNYNGYPSNIQSQYPINPANGMSSNQLDPAAPLPNEIFELLNEFWRPNDMNVGQDPNMTNNKVGSRRSPEGSLDETIDEEKDGDDDLTSSLGDSDMNIDRNTQKRRYSRLSDGYERLKSVLPSVKDKRRVSKARILDEAINYIQRLESITNVLKREHEKRLNVLNGSNNFFPDYSMQPYMRSLFQKQMYPQGLTGNKMNQYPKMSTTPSSMIAKSPRVKQYANQYGGSQNSLGVGTGSNMATDYNYNNISSYSNSSTGSMYQSSDPNQMAMNGDASPITNNSPYSACSLSPGATPTTYQEGNSTVNNTWPYQGATINGYSDSVNQLSSYNQSRQTSSEGYGSSSVYSSSSLWGSMAGSSSGVVSHPDHAMKVG